MRRGALFLVLLATACGQSGDEPGASGNRLAPGFTGDSGDVAATLALAASGPGGCSARWDDQPVTPQQVLERSSALIEQAIQRQGSITNLTEETLPTVEVTAPANLGFACADTYLAAIRRAGVPSILLALEGGGSAALADFTLSDIGAPPPSVVIALGGGGRLSWNNETIGLDAIPDHMRRLSGDGEAGIEAPPGELELRPAREASFGQLHAALSAVRAGHLRAALLLPSVQPSRPPAPVAAPVAAPAAPPAGNQAAPRP